MRYFPSRLRTRLPLRSGKGKLAWMPLVDSLKLRHALAMLEPDQFGGRPRSMFYAWGELRIDWVGDQPTFLELR